MPLCCWRSACWEQASFCGIFWKNGWDLPWRAGVCGAFRRAVPVSAGYRGGRVLVQRRVVLHGRAGRRADDADAGRQPERAPGWRAQKRSRAALCWALLFALGMDNYITAMMTAAALLMLALWRRRRRAAQTAIRTALMLISHRRGAAAFSDRAGQQVRMATDGAHESGLGYLLASIGWTMRDAVKYILRFCSKRRCWRCCCWRADGVPPHERSAARRANDCPIGFTLLGRLSDALRDDYSAHVFLRVRGVGARRQHVSQLCAACSMPIVWRWRWRG